MLQRCRGLDRSGFLKTYGVYIDKQSLCAGPHNKDYGIGVLYGGHLVLGNYLKNYHIKLVGFWKVRVRARAFKDIFRAK